MNIPEVLDKFKMSLRGVPEDLIIVAIIVLVGISGFGLGRLSILETNREPVHILEPNGVEAPHQVSAVMEGSNSIKHKAQTASVKNSIPNNEVSSSGEVVASKNGTKYHLPWCSGAKRINEANKITFASKAEAEKAGYTPAANCPGL